MPSFDIVSKIDMQEADNAVNTAMRTIETRYDFKNSNTEIELNKKDKKITANAADETKMKAVQEMLISSFIKRGIDAKVLDFGPIEPTGMRVKTEVKLKEGISKETGKKIVKLIKDLKVKVQPAIQDDQVRVTGKKIDDLQQVIQLMKESKGIDVPLQYINMKS